MICEIFGHHHHQHHHSWYPTYCNIKGYLYTRGKLNLNICTKGCYFQFQCSVSIFKILTKNMFRSRREVFLVPVNWAIIEGTCWSIPLRQTLHRRCLKQEAFWNVMQSMTISQLDMSSVQWIGLDNLLCFVWSFACICSLCFAFLPGCEFASQTDLDEPSSCPWIHLKIRRWTSWMWTKFDHISTTCWWYPAKYRSDKLLPTHPLLPNYVQRDGNEIFWGR